MRPITLTFAGLRSYRAETIIDFRNLDLFAVIGDTGAGKSTIIEALSLALYARKSWAGGANLIEMIADGVNTMRIEFRFHADGHDWIVTRARHRNNSQPVDKLTSPTRGGPNIDGARPVNDRLAKLIGLSHEQFTRAVVMPQGRFDELLRANERERTLILSSILGLDDITLTRTTVEHLRNEWRPQLATYTERRRRYPDDPQAALDTVRAAQQNVRMRLDALEGALEQADLAAAQAQATARAVQTVADAVAAVPKPSCSDPSATLDGLHIRERELAAAHDSARSAVAAAEVRLTELSAEGVKVLGGFKSRDALVAATTRYNTVDADAEALATATAAVSRLTDSPPPRHVDQTLIDAHQQAMVVAGNAKRALEEAVATVERATTTWRAAMTARTTLQTCQLQHDTALKRHRQLTERATAAINVRRDAQQRVRDAEAAERAALLADAAATAAAPCAPGDSCPVCTQTLPPAFIPPPPGDHSAVNAQLADATSSLSSAEAELQEATSAADRARWSAESATEAVAVAEAAFAAAAAAASDAAVDIDIADEDAATADAQQAVQTAAAACAVADEQARAASNAVVSAQATLEAAVATHLHRVDTAQAELARTERAVVATQKVIDSVPPRWRPARITAIHIRTVVESFTAALAALDRAETQRRSATATRESAMAAATAASTALNHEIRTPAIRIVTEINTRAGRVRDVVAALTAGAASTDSSPSPIPPPTDVTADPDDLVTVATQVRRTVDDCASVLAAATSWLQTVRRIHDAAARTLSAAVASVGCVDVNDLRATHGRVQGEIAAADAAVLTASGEIAVAEALDRVIAVAGPFVANLEVLVVALRDQHFVGHLVKARENELLGEATRRLKTITNGRFGFVTGFGVVNIASGEIRSPDTLSGGERFQAALSLALALVEIASRGSGRLDAVFVDEGFGSLDSGALDMALETLGKVAGAGKMVALISHLRPVAEYVDTVLHVTKDDMLGSRIEVLDSDARERLLADDARSGLTA